jgi:hypothetical protein
MPTQMSEEEILELAKKRVREKRDFYRNLGTWAVVNIILIIVWAFPAGGGYPWFLWPLCGWGIFVFINFLKVFVFPKKDDNAAIEKEVEKIKRG